jgi:hypothetical protein
VLDLSRRVFPALWPRDANAVLRPPRGAREYEPQCANRFRAVAPARSRVRDPQCAPTPRILRHSCPETNTMIFTLRVDATTTLRACDPFERIATRRRAFACRVTRARTKESRSHVESARRRSDPVNRFLERTTCSSQHTRCELAHPSLGISRSDPPALCLANAIYAGPRERTGTPKALRARVRFW